MDGWTDQQMDGKINIKEIGPDLGIWHRNGGIMIQGRALIQELNNLDMFQVQSHASMGGLATRRKQQVYEPGLQS